MELAPWYLHLEVLCHKQLAAISQEHAITLVARRAKRTRGP